jgi:phosphatidylinositol alpha-1,6-mannosyltransferase
VTDTPRCLFVTRKYPPSVGGMETLAAATARALASRCDLTVISLGRSQRHLAWWLPWATIRTRMAVHRSRARNRPVDVIVFGDALTYCAVRPFLGRRMPDHLVMVMGLDLTFRLAPYQWLVRHVLPGAPRVAAISRTTADEARARGVPPERLSIVTPGVLDPDMWPERTAESGAKLRTMLNLDPDARILITVGRLVPRKGVKWFVEHVMARLPENVVYVIAGSGPDESAIREAVRAIGSAGARVHLLGRVDDELRAALYTGADIFVMPNLPIGGDMEGFGLVAMEAATAGVLVVASDLEGIRDAVIEDETGLLCPSGDVECFVARITSLLRDEPERARRAEQFARNAGITFATERMRDDLLSVINTPASP